MAEDFNGLGAGGGKLCATHWYHHRSSRDNADILQRFKRCQLREYLVAQHFPNRNPFLQGEIAFGLLLTFCCCVNDYSSIRSLKS